MMLETGLTNVFLTVHDEVMSEVRSAHKKYEKLHRSFIKFAHPTVQSINSKINVNCNFQFPFTTDHDLLTDLIEEESNLIRKIEHDISIFYANAIKLSARVYYEKTHVVHIIR